MFTARKFKVLYPLWDIHRISGASWTAEHNNTTEFASLHWNELFQRNLLFHQNFWSGPPLLALSGVLEQLIERFRLGLWPCQELGSHRHAPDCLPRMSATASDLSYKKKKLNEPVMSPYERIVALPVYSMATPFSGKKWNSSNKEKS